MKNEMESCHSGCRINPAEQVSGLKIEGHVESTFRVSGMDCSDEVNAIQNALSNPLISSVKANLINSTVIVAHSPDFSSQSVRRAIEGTGVKIEDGQEMSFAQSNRHRIHLVAGSGVFLGVGLLADWFALVDESILLLIFAFATLLAGYLIFPKAWRAFRQFTLDMNVLMTVACVGAFLIGEYSEAATVVFLFSLAELLEAFSVARARNAIREVLKLTPQIANLIRGDAVVAVPVLEVRLKDLLIIRPGESIPLDGLVIDGVSSVNQAPLTGESALIAKRKGDSVFAGTINENGSLTIEVTQEFQDTKISKVMRLIEEAQSKKAPSERFVDQFAKIYTPVIMILALLVCVVPPFAFGANLDIWIYRALVLLVIACPCALVIATPVSVVSGLASLARRGVLVKGGTYLEALGKLRAVALDKTGTITEGKFKVQDVKLFDGVDERKFLEISASLEAMSTHPLAKSVLSYTKSKDVIPVRVAEYRAVPGRGAEGRIGSHMYFVGNHRFAHELGVCTPELERYLELLEQNALSVVVVGHKPHDNESGSVIGVFSLGDRIRPNVKSAIAALHKEGIENVVVLSGDNQKTVDAIKRLSGIDTGLGDLLPEDKVREVKRLTEQFGYVAMVGDGVNDAPALAHATLGIAMGAAGTDTAIETSDIALMQDDLSELPKAIAQGRRVLSVIRFNIGFALATKIIFLVLAVIGRSNLWLAVAADMGASLFVTFNALRLLRVSEEPK